MVSECLFANFFERHVCVDVWGVVIFAWLRRMCFKTYLDFFNTTRCFRLSFCKYYYFVCVTYSVSGTPSPQGQARWSQEKSPGAVRLRTPLPWLTTQGRESSLCKPESGDWSHSLHGRPVGRVDSESPEDSIKSNNCIKVKVTGGERTTNTRPRYESRTSKTGHGGWSLSRVVYRLCKNFLVDLLKSKFPSEPIYSGCSY